MKSKSFYIFLAGVLLVVSLSLAFLSQCCHHSGHGYNWQSFKENGCQVFGVVSRAVHNHDAAWPQAGAVLALAVFVFAAGLAVLSSRPYLPVSRFAIRGWPPLRLAWQRGLIHPKIY